MQNFIPNMRNLVNSISPSIALAGVGGGNTYHLTVKIGSVTGDKKGADYLVNEMYKGIKGLN